MGYPDKTVISLNEKIKNESLTQNILQEADAITGGDRQENYGHPKKNFADIAKVWGVVLGMKVTPRQVGQCMVMLKVCRDMHYKKRDNLVDIAGYARNMEMIDD